MIAESKIKQLRRKSGITQQELADAAGLHVRQIQKVETGESVITNITLGSAIKIADALGVSDVRSLL